MKSFVRPVGSPPFLPLGIAAQCPSIEKESEKINLDTPFLTIL